LAHSRHVGSELGAQLFENSIDFTFFLLLQIEDIVIDTDDAFRFDESGFTCGRLIVDNPADFSFVLCRNTEYTTAVAKAFYAIGQPSFLAVILRQGAELLVELLLLAECLLTNNQ